MTSLRPYLLAGLAALLLLAGGWVTHTYMRAEMTQLEARAKAAEARVAALELSRKADQSASRVREAKRVQAQREAKEARDALNTALATHRDWADQPVPDDVARVLNRTADGPGPGAVRGTHP